LILAGLTDPHPIDQLLEKSTDKSDHRFFTNIEVAYPDLSGFTIVPTQALIDTGASFSLFPISYLDKLHTFDKGIIQNGSSVGGGFIAYRHMTIWKLIFQDSSLWLSHAMAYSDKAKYPILGVDFLRWFDFKFTSENYGEFNIDLTLNRFGQNLKGQFIHNTLEDAYGRITEKFCKDHNFRTIFPETQEL
jgi:hypothetical protein